MGQDCRGRRALLLAGDMSNQSVSDALLSNETGDLSMQALADLGYHVEGPAHVGSPSGETYQMCSDTLDPFGWKQTASLSFWVAVTLAICLITSLACVCKLRKAVAALEKASEDLAGGEYNALK